MKELNGKNELTVIREDDRLLVSASDLFSALKRYEPADGTERQDAFRRWLADRIVNFEMEEGCDFFIYLNAGSIREMLRYESAPENVWTFFDNIKQYAL
jgi:hypothetical protein